MVNPVGPVFTGGFEEFVVDEEGTGEKHTILYLPDLNNDALQAEGKPPVYYWAPGSVRLAKNDATSTYKFHHTHFVGDLDEQTTVGVEGHTEVVGGVLAFTTTSRYPTEVLKKAHDQLLKKFSGRDDRYWGTRTSVTPEFRIVPITRNTTAVTNLAPGANGTAPAENINPPVPPAPPAPAPAGGGAPPGPRSDMAGRSMIRRADLSGPVAHGARFQPRSNLDAWAFELQGQGPGSVTGGENAYAGLMGAYPSEIIWTGFHGGYSPIAVAQHMIMPMWSQEIYLKITGNWDRIFSHFSAAANGRYLWFAADVQAEFNNLRISGGIKVDVMIDGTTPEGADMEKAIEKRIELITAQFMTQASKVIFEPPQPTVAPAQAPSGGIFSSIFGYGGGVALKARRDSQSVDLFYEETRHFRYNQSNTISSTFEGFYSEMKKDPDAERKYFTRLLLGQLSKKITRIVKPVVNWPDPSKSWVGEPVAFLSASIGYPGMDGVPAWRSQVFQSTDTGDSTTFQPTFAQLLEGEATDPPDDWDPDETFLKRKVHLKEAPGLSDDPFVKLIIERNEIDLDPGEYGTLSRDAVVEVRADSAGKLEIGPITVDTVLEDAKQIIEVEFKVLGRSLDGAERQVVRFSWNHADQATSRYYEIFTGDTSFVPAYQYRVTCTVKGTFTTRGMSWVGPWVDSAGNGPLMVRVPMPDDAGVIQTKMTPRAIAGADRAAAPSTGAIAAPPSTSAPVPAMSSSGAGSGPGAPPTGGSRAPAGKPGAPRRKADRSSKPGTVLDRDDEIGGWVVLPGDQGS